jgi:hypothetical protein
MWNAEAVECLEPRMEASMHYSDYLREEAANYRRMAELAHSDADRNEFLEMAEVCEEVAGQVDDLRASG